MTSSSSRTGPLLVAGLLLALIFSSSTVLVQASGGDVARLAYFNYPSEMDGLTFSPGDFGRSQIQEAMAPLAVMLFNERRGDILPALGNLTWCNKNLSIPYSCAAAGNARIAFSHVLELTSLPTDFPHMMYVWC